MKTMTGAQIVIESLLAEGVDTIFGYPGGAILPTYDALIEFARNCGAQYVYVFDDGAWSCIALS